MIGASNRRQDSREEAGYAKLDAGPNTGLQGRDGGRGSESEAEAYELAEHDSGSSLDEDATKIEGDEADWMDPDRRETRSGAGVRI